MCDLDDRFFAVQHLKVLWLRFAYRSDERGSRGEVRPLYEAGVKPVSTLRKPEFTQPLVCLKVVQIECFQSSRSVTGTTGTPFSNPTAHYSDSVVGYGQE